MKEIELVPNPSSLIEATRSIGYSLETSIADLLDNSVTAGAKNIWITFESDINSPYVSILDDGCGMNENNLRNAMMYGSSDPVFVRNKNDLGRFGLGLKTASMSQCRQLTVISKSINSEINGLIWDLDFLRKHGKWSVLELSKKDLEERILDARFYQLDSGTLIIWNTLDRLFEGSSEKSSEILSKKMTETRDHLSLVFHRYIEGDCVKQINIYMNNNLLQSIDPFMSNKSTKIMDPERFKVNYLDNNKNHKEDYVTITPYVLPYPDKFTLEEKKIYMEKDSLKLGQGFYVYRNHRLIIWGTWFKLLRLEDSYKLARVKVDIPNTLDFMWSLDIKKSTATPPHELKPVLKKIIEQITDRSTLKFTYRKKLEENKEYYHIWDKLKSNQGNEYKINREHPIYNDIIQNLSKKEKNSFEFLIKIIESKLPLNSIFIDFAGDNFKKDNVIIEDEYYEIAKKYLSICSSLIEIEEASNRLIKLDIFEGKKELIEKIKKEAIECLEI